MNDAPIGIFDSGLGGLTVARAIIDYLPGENIIYLGDTANTPYGPRRIAEIRDLTMTGLDALVDRGCKVLVIACNPGTAAAVADARERYSVQQGIPVVEVITPAAREAALTTRNGRIGVIGTEATVSSQSYPTALGAVPGVEVFQQACPEFVDFVERGVTTGSELERITKEYLSGLKAEEVDTVILGCTHYPLLQGALARELGEGVNLVTSSEATAREVYMLLVENDLLHTPRPSGTSEYRFLMTAPSDRFTALARRFLGPEVNELELIRPSNS